jgi:hypothetical protein
MLTILTILTFNTSNAGSCTAELGFRRVNHSPESLRMIHSQVGQNFPVDDDVFGMKQSHEFGIAEVERTNTCIDTGDPETPESPFLGTTVTIGVTQAFLVSIFGYCPDIFSPAELAFDLF